MEKMTQQLGATSSTPTLPPAASQPSPNQTPLPSKKESHIVAIIILTAGGIFVIGAIIWLASDYITPRAKTKKTLDTTVTSISPTIAVPGSPTSPSTPPPSHAPTAYPGNAPPPPTAAEFASLSVELRSGNSFRFAGVTALNPKTIPESTLEKYATMQALVF